MVAAFSLAMLLNRTLVMPKFVCFCDRYWCAVLLSDLLQTEATPLHIHQNALRSE